MAYLFGQPGNDQHIGDAELKARMDRLARVAGRSVFVGFRPDNGAECDIIFDVLSSNNRKAILVEAWGKNIEQFQRPGVEARVGDIRDYKRGLSPAEMDFLVWWAGPEHMEKEDGERLLGMMKEDFDAIAIATPDGPYPQGSREGNPYEEHKSAWTLEDYARLGFRGTDKFIPKELIGLWERTMPVDLLSHLIRAISRADILVSRVTVDVAAIGGLTGAKVTHLLNNLCRPTDAVFLEVGAWQGATAAAAACGNSGEFVTVDDFSAAHGDAEGTRKHFADTGVGVALIEGDCWKVPMADLPHGVNVFFFDGPHDYESHRQALYHFNECLASQFIFVVDDWEDKVVRDATFAGIEDADLRMLAYLWLGYGEHESGAGWWNSLGAFVLKKQ